MADFNQIILIGRLTKDPEINYTKSDEPVAIARFGLAVARKFPVKGEKVTDFFDIEAWGKKADFAKEHLSKGQTILVMGSMFRYEWGENPKKFGYKVNVEDFRFISGKVNNTENQSSQTQTDSGGIPEGFDPLGGGGDVPPSFDPLAKNEDDMYFNVD